MRGAAVVGAADPPGLDVGGVMRSIAWWIRLMRLSAFFTPSRSSPLGASCTGWSFLFRRTPCRRVLCRWSALFSRSRASILVELIIGQAVACFTTMAPRGLIRMFALRPYDVQRGRVIAYRVRLPKHPRNNLTGFPY